MDYEKLPTMRQINKSKIKLLREVKKELKGKFFTVEFTKKDGSTRKMTARLGVTKHLKGGVKRYNDEDFNYLTVFDLGKKAYRTVNLNTVSKLQCGKDLTHLVR